MKTLSIIIPIYNTPEEYFSKCLASLRCTHAHEVEIIAVDDGSKPEFSAKIQKLIDSSPLDIQYYKKENGGQNSAREYGLELSDGQHIFFMDADDYVDTIVLDKIIALLKKYHPKVLAFNYDVRSPNAVIFAFRSFYAASFTTSELNESIAILILLFVNMTFTLQGSVYLTVLTGHEKYTFLRILSILMQVIQPLLVILCVSRIPYAITVSVVIVLLNLLTIGIRYGYVTQKLKIRITKQPKDSRIVKSILGLSAAILLGSIADQIFWKTDQVILGRMFNTAVVAVYSVGAQIYMMYMQFGTQVSGVFYPKISALYQEENGLQKVSDLFIRIGRITFYIILLILSGFIIFGREFLLLWVGEGYEEAYWVAIIVMLPFSIDLAQNLVLCILQIKGQYGFRARIYFLSAVLNIVTTAFSSVGRSFSIITRFSLA